MTKKSCDWENKIINCLKSGKLTPEIKNHLSECPFCQDILTVHTWIQQFKEKAWPAEILKKTLPDAETIWKGAYAIRRPDKALVKKAMRPLLFTRLLSYLVFIIGAIILLLSFKEEIGHLFNSSSAVGQFLGSLSTIITQSFPFFFIPAVIIFISMLCYALVVAWEKRKKPA